MKYDILFLGKIFPKEKEAEIKAKMKTGMQDAGNALQWNVIDGLDDNDCGILSILDYLPIDSYPNGYADRHISEYTFHHTDRYPTEDKIVGCTNLTVVKQFFNIIPFRRAVKRWLETDLGLPKVLLMYTASTIFLQLAKYVKRRRPDIKICCMIADLPEFLSARDLRGMAKLFNRYEVKKSTRLYRSVDGFVLLTRQMADRLQLSVPYTVVEGIATAESAAIDATLAEQYADIPYILYSGTLNYKFGIGTLLEAFSLVERQDVRLLICGFGEAEEMISKSKDPRVVYLGKLDRRAVLALQRGAAVLVNPRQNNEEFTKYSFPSKNLEYLSSGVPLVAYQLDGIPSEYDEYIRYPEDNTPAALACALSDMCDLSEEERHARGDAARAFVSEKKNRTVQAKKILDLIARL